MSRPSQSRQRRQELIPVIARAFSELGYRRATTAVLGERCGVRENVLYRLWPDKRAMFVASIEHVYERSRDRWERLLASDGRDGSAAERLLRFEGQHHGEFGLYRIVFAGLSETDDPVIHDALRHMYRRFHGFIRRQIEIHLDGDAAADPTAELRAWAIVGLGTVANIGRELNLLPASRRKRLFGQVGGLLLEGCTG